MACDRANSTDGADSTGDADSTGGADSSDDPDSTDEEDTAAKKWSKPDKPGSPPPPIPVPPDLADLIGSLQQQIGALNSGQAVRKDPAPSKQAQTPATNEFGDTPLTQGQSLHVDHLLSVETDSLAREVLITLRREGLPPKSQWNDFMTQYARWSWDFESDAQALATLDTIAKSDWDEWLEQADSAPVESTAQDLGR